MSIWLYLIYSSNIIKKDFIISMKVLTKNPHNILNNEKIKLMDILN